MPRPNVTAEDIVNDPRAFEAAYQHMLKEERGEQLHRRGVSFIADHRRETRGLVQVAARRRQDGGSLTFADVIAAYYEPDTGKSCPQDLVPVVKREVAKAAPYLADSCGARPSDRLDWLYEDERAGWGY